MAIVQALVAFLTRSLGRVLGGLFGWAVVAIFGHTSPGERLFLSGLLAAAGAWPVLLLGIVAPKVAVFVLSFVPLSSSVPSWIVRLVWLGLAVVVPLAVGIVMAARRPETTPRRHWLRDVMSGFAITVGLSAALLLTLLTVPVVRVMTLIRRQQDSQVPLITDATTYPRVAHRAALTLERHGLPVRRRPPPWWLLAPLKILKKFGGDVFATRLPSRFAYLEGSGLILALYPSSLLIRGPEQVLARAQGLIVEDLSDLPVWQTFDPRAQDIERQIARVWEVYRQRPEDHRDAAPLLSRLWEIGEEIRALPVEYDEWQVVYRKASQLRVALHGERQLLERPMEHEEEHAMREHEYAATPYSTDARALGMRDLVEEITKKGYLLAQKELALAREELKEDIRAELAMAKLLAGAAVAAIVGVTLLLVALALAVTAADRLWLGPLVVGAVVVIAAAGLGFYGWQRRVQKPLDLTRQSLKESWQWAKERVA
jgi:hypothetical protein